MKKFINQVCFLLREHKKKLIVMRHTFLILLVSTFQALAAGSYAQSKAINLSLTDATIREVLSAIENQSEFNFLYNSELINVERIVSITVEGEKVDEILTRLFDKNNVGFSIRDRYIVLTPVGGNPALSSSQQQTVSGKVTDSSGQPLPGVAIVIKGTTQGTVTGIDGSYSLVVPAGATALQFSFVGMRTQDVLLDGRSSFNVVMEDETIGIEEVVAIGYGVQKKVNLTGSVAVLGGEMLENKSTPNTIAAMQGQLPGVTITRTSGAPGSEDYQMLIRGISSVSTVNPLIIVDGAVGSLTDLNPNDIQTISVLKDAAAASIYGSNAAGGVILVTTKSGSRDGKVSFSYSGSVGMKSPVNMPERVDTWVEATMQNEARTNAGLPLQVDPQHIKWMQGLEYDVADMSGIRPSDFSTGEGWYIHPNNPNVWSIAGNFDRVRETTKKMALTHQHNLSARGGNEKNAYYLSAGYYRQDGIFKYGPDSHDRYNLLLNLDNKFNDYFSLKSSIGFKEENVDQNAISHNELFSHILNRRQNYPQYDPNGNYYSDGTQGSVIKELREAGIDSRKDRMLDMKTNFQMANVIEGLSVNLIGAKRFGFNKRFQNKRTLTYYGVDEVTPIYIESPQNSMSRVSSNSDYSSLQAFATYSRTFNRHHFTVLGGYSFEEYRFESFTGATSNLVTNDFYSLHWSDAGNQTTSDDIRTSALAAYFGRLNYNFKEKYLFEANFRYDGSSRLAPDVRWNFFPSFSAGWNISKEPFFQGVTMINDLKLRASWGQLGNSDALGYYDHIALLSAASDYPFNNSRTQYIYQNTLASPTKTWETIESQNIGIDIYAFDNRFSFSGDIYIKKNKNMLAGFEVPRIIGIGLPSYNIGELETRGWEFNVTWKDRINDFKYWVNFNLSDNTNELTKFSGRNVVTAGRVKTIEGMPLNTIWGYRTDGYFQSEQELENYAFIHNFTGVGDVKYLDLDDSGRITAGKGTMEDHGDLVHLGDDHPRYLFGLNLGFEWKGFDFSSFFQGVGKRVFYPNENIMNVAADSPSGVFTHQTDYWRPDNRNAYFPRLYSESNHNYWNSDHFLQNGAYLRLKNIEIGYTLPQSVTSVIKLDRVRLYVSGQDLFEISNTLPYINPEYPDGAEYIYPFSRIVSTGLNVTF